MAHVIASRRLRFVDAEGEVETIPQPTAQPFPDRFLRLPYFSACVQSGWIQQVVLEEAATEEVDSLIPFGTVYRRPEPAPRKKRNVLP